MKLENIKFGDKFKTKDGRIAIVINEHQNARKHWYEFVSLEEETPMLGNSSYKFFTDDNGIAFEGFNWLNIVDKL